MQTLLNIGIALGVLILVWGFAMIGLGYAILLCRRLIGLVRQHSS